MRTCGEEPSKFFLQIVRIFWLVKSSLVVVMSFCSLFCQQGTPSDLGADAKAGMRSGEGAS